MRRHGLICTPISTFGIGVLSCFMIADRIQVRTHPGEIGSTRRAHDLEISGPGSLFWTRPGTRKRQGTEVTLWLRKQHRLALKHNRESCFAKLRRFFEYDKQSPEPAREEKDLDPGLIAAKHVIWPKYPVHIQPPAADHWTIDDDFHIDHLAPLDATLLRAKLLEWDYPGEAARDPAWDRIDWTDNEGAEATGTRLRIWYPASRDSALNEWELATFVEPQVQSLLPRMMLQSMDVADVEAIGSALPCTCGPGCRIWIDLRGGVSPPDCRSKQGLGAF
jgi:hypothetical protein